MSERPNLKSSLRAGGQQESGIAEEAPRLKRWMRWLILGIITVGAALVAKHMMTQRQEVKPLEPVNVTVMHVSKRVETEAVSFAGRVEPVSDVLVAAETGGRFTEMPVDLGSTVKAGDILIKIDDSLARSAMVRASAEFADAERDLKRVEGLSASGAVSISVLDGAKTRMAFARAGLDQAQTMLGKCTVASPIDGRVEQRFVEPGEYAKDGDVAFRIADMSKAKVIVYVPETDVVDVKNGQKMSFRAGAIPDATFQGTVVFVAHAGDAMNHAFRVDLVVDNEDGVLRGGMIADVILERQTHGEVIRIPFSAVLPRKGEHIVFTWENGRAVRRTVRIHSMVGDSALIASGLEAGEYLVVEGQRFLQDGKRINVMGDIIEN